ncbi:hypothetical protein GCM10007904_43570 [Oharaeibacter diazotrophicus]|nr:hypothetical protein GCM10007904_43570 [Oharaeibacter diazotrophicus]
MRFPRPRAHGAYTFSVIPLKRGDPEATTPRAFLPHEGHPGGIADAGGIWFFSDGLIQIKQLRVSFGRAPDGEAAASRRGDATDEAGRGSTFGEDMAEPLDRPRGCKPPRNARRDAGRT